MEKDRHPRGVEPGGAAEDRTVRKAVGSAKPNRPAAAREQASDFLARWADGGDVLLVAIAPTKKGQTTAASFDGTGEAAAWIERQNRTRGVYFSPNRCRPGLYRKAVKADMAGIRGAWADVDPGPELEAETRLAAERQRLRALADELTALPWPPTAIIDSGNGVQPLWRLEVEVEAEHYRPAAGAIPNQQRVGLADMREREREEVR